MELLEEIHNTDIGLPNKLCDYRERRAVRAVITHEGKIALQHVGKHGYYKLPGGGVDAGESDMEALAREIMEEVGCKINVMGEIGKIIEYRDDFNLKQLSLCFFGTVAGEISTPEFTEEERTDEMEALWVAPGEALRLIKESVTDDYEGKFIIIRDAILLENYPFFSSIHTL